MQNKALVISIFSLGLFIFIGSLIISNSIKQIEIQGQNQIEQKQKKQLLSASELAEYLGISDTELSNLLSFENNPGPGEIGISSIEINGKLYYPVKAVDEWLLTGEGKYRKTANE
ncbi:hypothetical protein WQ54_15205 [Bacillus sp. SA1-12]|uniref:helix-turn-helix domain-containing protein n=1 Tax=Bacillus sp. SA1-12 TaxID=1455638 RepID=UPI0006264CD9|nr:helix-turn-helix domain-containing protein [Bacillus sp. SA1-12]KKI91369.1 hypothetical protein WQ54_15205 [Bacillus sp. SA1-12]